MVGFAKIDKLFTPERDCERQDDDCSEIVSSACGVVELDRVGGTTGTHRQSPARKVATHRSNLCPYSIKLLISEAGLSLRAEKRTFTPYNFCHR